MKIPGTGPIRSSPFVTWVTGWLTHQRFLMCLAGSEIVKHQIMLPILGGLIGFKLVKSAYFQVVMVNKISRGFNNYENQDKSVATRNLILTIVSLSCAINYISKTVSFRPVHRKRSTHEIRRVRTLLLQGLLGSFTGVRESLVASIIALFGHRSEV